MSNVRLELVWPNKDKFLLSPEDENGKPVWVERNHPAAREVRLTEFTDAVGDVSNDSPESDNLLFVGDSLDALRILKESPAFRREYRGKVKLIYIDPPFNTGETFEHYDDWMEHSTWLSFMRDRLDLIRDLLSPDGSVWVHLDDIEQHRMKALLDEIFGAQNFISTMVWQKADSPRNNTTAVSVDHDYIHVYAKNKLVWKPVRMERTAAMNAIYKSPDGDAQDWFDDNPTAPGAITHQGMVYAIQSPFTGKLIYPALGRCWAGEQSRILRALSEWAEYELFDFEDAAERARVCGVAEADVRSGVLGLRLKNDLESSKKSAQARYDAGTWPEFIFRSGGEGGIGLKRYQPNNGVPPRSLWLNEEVGHNRTAKAESKALVPNEVSFSTPKPEKLLERVIHIGSNPGDIVMDFFAGSGTTAAVAHKMKRRWVTCEIQASTAQKYTAARLKKVVDGSDQGGISTSLHWNGGGGFRVVEVQPSFYAPTDLGLMLVDDAYGPRFAKAVAGQLGFDWEPSDGSLCGRRGRMRLAVFDGAVGVEELGSILGELGEAERVTVVARVVLEGTEEWLAQNSKGSLILKAPGDVLRERRSRRRNSEGDL
jgi:DNA modification methylase